MNAKDMMDFKNWVVVGDVANKEKYAHRILNKLKNSGYNAEGVNPRAKEAGIFISLKDVPYKIDVIDLCINPVQGIEIIKEAAFLKIDKVLIQPGAGSEKITDYCINFGIKTVEGCVLVELSNI